MEDSGCCREDNGQYGDDFCQNDKNRCQYGRMVAVRRAGTVYRNTDNITVCLLKNGYRFLPLLPKVIVNVIIKTISCVKLCVFISFCSMGVALSLYCLHTKIERQT